MSRKYTQIKQPRELMFTGLCAVLFKFCYTNSISAVSALSPLRNPVFNTRV